MAKQTYKPSLDQVEKHIDQLCNVKHSLEKLLEACTQENETNMYDTGDGFMNHSKNPFNFLDELIPDLHEYIEDLNDQAVEKFK
jgi:hypothetical protein